MPTRDSLIAFFLVGAVLLLAPLILVLVLGAHTCSVVAVGDACTLTSIYKVIFPSLPYIMLVGGVLIGYNLKRISDSLLPPELDEVS